MNLTSLKTFDLPLMDRTLDYLSGDMFNKHMNGIVQAVMVPLIAFGVFLMLWSAGARNVETSLGQLPGPAKVWEQVIALYDEHKEERAKEEAFYTRMQERLERSIAAGKSEEKLDKIRARKYTGAPTFIDQIKTSLITVAFGFVIVSIRSSRYSVLCPPWHGCRW
jgi:nitrate/nitrite transport system permease protein